MWRCFGIQNTENGAVLGATAALLSSLPPPPQPLFLASPLQPTKNLKRYRSGTQIFGISLSRIDLETEHRENTASVAMEGSESKAVFESLNLNPQCFTDEFYNCVADLVDSAFGFFHQKAANIVKANEGTERSAELKKVTTDEGKGRWRKINKN